MVINQSYLSHLFYVFFGCNLISFTYKVILLGYNLILLDCNLVLYIYNVTSST